MGRRNKEVRKLSEYISMTHRRKQEKISVLTGATICTPLLRVATSFEFSLFTPLDLRPSDFRVFYEFMKKVSIENWGKKRK